MRSIIIQSWLCFSLARETLGRDVLHGEFIERSAPDDYDPWIDARIQSWFWHKFRARWSGLKKTLSEHDYSEKQRRAQECVTVTEESVGILASINRLDSKLCPVFLFVHMLLYFMTNIVEG